MGDNLAGGLKSISESLSGVARMFQTATLTKDMPGGPYYDPEMAKLAYEQRRMDLNDLLIRKRMEGIDADIGLKGAKTAKVGGERSPGKKPPGETTGNDALLKDFVDPAAQALLDNKKTPAATRNKIMDAAVAAQTAASAQASAAKAGLPQGVGRSQALEDLLNKTNLTGGVKIPSQIMAETAAAGGTTIREGTTPTAISPFQTPTAPAVPGVPAAGGGETALEKLRRLKQQQQQ